MGNEPSAIESFLRGSGINALGRFLGLGLGFFGNIIIGRVLGAVALGEIALVLVLINIFSLICVLGLHQGLVRYLPRVDNIQSRHELISSALIVVLPFSIVVSALLYLGSPTISGVFFDSVVAIFLVQIMAVAVPVQTLKKLLVGLARGLKDAKIKVIVNDLATPIIQFALIILAITYGYGTIGIGAAYVLSFLSGVVLFLWLIWRNHLVKFQPVNVLMRPDLFKFSFPLVLTSILAFSLHRIDRLFISYFGSTGEVGIYSAMANLAMFVIFAQTTFNFMFYPQFSEYHSMNDHENMEFLYQFVTKWAVIFSLPIIITFVLFPSITIQLTFGQGFIDGVDALVILAISIYSNVIFGPNGDAVKALGQSRNVNIGTAIAFLANIILNMILIPRSPLLGAAIATGVAYLLWNLYYSYIIWNETSILPCNKALLRLLLACVALSSAYIVALSELTADRTIVFIVFLMLAGLTYPVAIWYTGVVNEQDIDIIKSFI